MILQPPDYWKLRALSADVEQQQATLAAVQARLETARQRREQLWVELTQRYELDPAAQYAAKDEDCSLTVADPPKGSG